MTAPPTAARCTQPGCSGVIEDGYCNVCGTPAGTSGAGGAAGAAAGANLPLPGAAAGGAHAAGAALGGAVVSPASSRVSTRTSSSRLASAAIGSARTGSRATRRAGTTSTRLRAHRIGAGLTEVPPTPVENPLDAVLPNPEVAEGKRVCPGCGSPVGRSRDGVPGRTKGFCPKCGARFDFDPALSPGDVLGGQYEVVGAIAHGGLGWVYLARDLNVSGRFVVLKGLLNSGDKDAYEAAIAEREFLAEVEHPLIVEIYNFVMSGTGEDAAGYTVMEYVGGKSLKEILKDRQARAGGRIDPLPVDQALAYLIEILPAFGYLHERGLLYCDFKPDNVIQQGDSLKLIDLGGVRRITDETSAIFGTVGYQAPEVPTEGPSVASDIYTIGRTLATLVLDFRGNTTTYVASLPPVSDTPLFAEHDSFYRLLLKACAPDPSDRFASVDELRTQMLGVLREEVAAKPTTTRPLPSTISPYFENPTNDAPDVPLRWDELPRLRVDPSDPMAAWLAGITDPVGRVQALAGATQVTREVKLARVYAAVEAGLANQAEAGAAALLTEDPWEWRALWLQGLHELAAGDPVRARASLNAVYGQVPGELAPKLALAVACEQSDELDVAEQLYLVCGGTDATYTAASAFGLARIRARRRDVAGTLAALDMVPRTRGSYPVARARRAGVLVSTARDYDHLQDALGSIDGVPLSPTLRAELEIAAYEAALRLSGGGASVSTGVRLAGVEIKEGPLRLALEKAYRERARLAETADERIDLVDRANAVRPRTLT
ncbi:serine/threonine-protein kinase PknG [Salana multivorans]|uniref:non-specific serine/threonine protein kinase n=1 Tax=Salana multivorans TaxID=120377 RepID=A0A3N2DBC6_9MICO|nr:serine/threonine-protein kinase [Salana multivorans]ROR97110.1 serine/threonine-protein kinase PknG [Salana multivorans]